MERDFTYVDYLVEGVSRCLSVLPEKQVPTDICNIGNSQPIKLMDFISCMEEQLGKKDQKLFLPMQDGDVKRTWADTSKL
jgi:UDP-glucuronate 4-epimerase